MSQSEVTRFQEYLKSRPDLLRETGPERMSDAVAIAAEHGFKFGLADLKTFLAARAATKGRTLTEAQLDKIAGGFNVGCTTQCGKCMGTNPTNSG